MKKTNGQILEEYLNNMYSVDDEGDCVLSKPPPGRYTIIVDFDYNIKDDGTIQVLSNGGFGGEKDNMIWEVRRKEGT